MPADLRLGLTAALGAYMIWGLLPLYFKVLGHIPPTDMLAHRIVWSVPTGIVFLAISSRWDDLRLALTPGKLKWLLLSGCMIGANWFLYIWAVGEDRVMEASLGYYINPLVNVLIGFVFLSERLRVAQWIAVGLAAIGVLIMTAAFGRFPWVSLVLCLTFAIYSLIRKQVQVDARAGFVVEAAMLLPVAAGWLIHRGILVGADVLGQSVTDIPLLILSGPITAVPLILFAIAAKRLMLSTVGMFQYLAPTLQFLIALLLGEPFGLTHAIAFGFIWAALILFTTDSVLGNRRARRLARAAQVS
ncbi:MAG: EamA family transporter RarD [Pseudomonadota bacterium]